MKHVLTRLLVVAASVVASVSVFADSVDVHHFNPTANFNYVYSEDALLGRTWGSKPQHRLFAGVYYDWVNRPLVELDYTRTYRVADIVKAMHSLNFVFAYHVLDDLQLSADTSLVNVVFPDGSVSFGLGELRLQGKYKLNSDQAAVTLAVMPQLLLPTGREALFLSSGTVGGGVKLAAEKDLKEVQVAANIGYIYNPGNRFRDLNMSQSIPFSLSTLIPIGSRWGVNAEANAMLLLPLNAYSTPSSFYLGGRYKVPGDLYLTFGGGVGSMNNYSSADFKVILGLTFAPFTPETPAPVVVPPPPAPAPPPRVTFTTKEVIIREEVKFQYDKAVLTPAGKDLLNEVAKVMKDNDRYYDSILIEGHTDENGSHEYNMVLSRKRAIAVKDYLIGLGVKGEKLKSMGYGKTRYKLTKKDMPNKATRDAANRRVEFKVFQTTAKTKEAIKEITPTPSPAPATSPAPTSTPAPKKGK